MQKSLRLKRELKHLMESPTEGISCYPKGDNLEVFIVTIMGPQGTAYEGGVFHLELQISDRYPFEPPRIIFRTPVYHPNIDDSGRICLDLLKMPPEGSWAPTINLKNLLDAVRLLLQSPNTDDPLMAAIADEYRFNRAEFERKALQTLVNTQR